MWQDFTINEDTISVDLVGTKAFYQTQQKIVDDCSCGDCRFYADDFVRRPYALFKLLYAMNVDLEKNLDSEPTGVWCIREGEDGPLLSAQQVYQVSGKMKAPQSGPLLYEHSEDGFRMKAMFDQVGPERISVELTIEAVIERN